MLAVEQGSDGLLTTSPWACLPTPMAVGAAAADTGLVADDAPWIDPVVVPDDIRSLQADIDAYRREIGQGRRSLRERLASSPTWRDWGFPAGVVAGAIALATIVFVVLTFAGTNRHPHVAAGAVGSPTAAVGTLHGLLPDVTIQTQTGDREPARDLRPALLALLPQPCGCAARVDQLAGQAAEVGVPLVVVAPAAVDAEVAALPGQSHRGKVLAAFDPVGALASTYAASGVTVLVLAPDATVTYIHRGTQPGEHDLELPLMSGIVADSPARTPVAAAAR
jgi:hypothetical protein